MIIIETGTGVTGANSYATLAQALAYHTARLNDAWTLTANDAARSAALIRATDYIEATYRAPSAKLVATQGLQWPIDSEGLPSPLVTATVMLALYALDKPLFTPAARGASKTTKKLEGLGELTTEFDEPISDPYPMITSMLAPLIEVAGSGGLIVGRLIR